MKLKQDEKLRNSELTKQKSELIMKRAEPTASLSWHEATEYRRSR